MDVIAGGRSSRSRGRLAHDFNDLSTSLLDLRNEGAIKPRIVVDHLPGRLLTNSRIERVGELGG